MRGTSSAAAHRSPPEVTIQNPCQYREAGARRLRPWLVEMLASLVEAAPRLPSTFVLRFVSDREMRQLNRLYRNQDKTTDVLSFPGEKSPEGDHVGDVVISVPTARKQAHLAGHGIETELKILILHGLLHCLGHDHETDDGEMKALEQTLRRQWIAHAHHE